MSVIIDGTNGITLPYWSTSTRPASPTAGELGFNSTLNYSEYFNGTSWVRWL